MEALAYLRVSGKGQVDGDGYRRQREAITAYAEAHGVSVAKWYQEAYTGDDLDGNGNWSMDRPAFSAMVADLLSNGMRMILVESLDRLARRNAVQEHLVIYLASQGLELINTATGENVTEAFRGDPLKKALIQIQGVFAELEKGRLVARLNKARAQKRLTDGRCEGRKPFGERAGELETLKRMRQLRGRGQKRLSYQKVADKLNEEERATRGGGKWQPSAVRGILRRKAR